MKTDCYFNSPRNHLNHAWRIQHHPSHCCRPPSELQFQWYANRIGCIQTLDHQNKPSLNIESIYVNPAESGSTPHPWSAWRAISLEELWHTTNATWCNYIDQLAKKLTLEPKRLTPPKPKLQTRQFCKTNQNISISDNKSCHKMRHSTPTCPWRVWNQDLASFTHIRSTRFNHLFA